MQRKNRLSRSRDFDAVYRHGRSVSTRFLTLYWFARTEEPGEPRLGLAVPKAAGSSVVRNRIKRQLREIWRAKLDGDAVAGENDYVLVVRPGPARGGRELAATSGSASAWTRCSERRRHDARRGLRATPASAGDRPRLRLPLDTSACSSRRAPASTTRAARSTRSSALRKHGLVKGSALGVLARSCAATRGRTAGSTTRDRLPARLQHPPPLENAVTWVLDRFHYNLGFTWAWAIVATTIVVRILLVPLTVRQIHSMQSLQKHAPEMKEIQRKYKGDKPKQNEEMMRFYKENHINPAASCLPLRRPAAGVHLALPRAEELLEAHPARLGPLLAPLRARHHREGRLALVGLRAARRLRGEPDLLDLLHVAGDGQDAADGS